MPYHTNENHRAVTPAQLSSYSTLQGAVDLPIAFHQSSGYDNRNLHPSVPLNHVSSYSTLHGAMDVPEPALSYSEQETAPVYFDLKGYSGRGVKVSDIYNLAGNLQNADVVINRGKLDAKIFRIILSYPGVVDTMRHIRIPFTYKDLAIQICEYIGMLVDYRSGKIFDASGLFLMGLTYVTVDKSKLWKVDIRRK